jgi:fructokinase
MQRLHAREVRHLLPARHEGWQLEVQYIAIALANLTFTLSPQRIVLGGGVGLRLPRRLLVAAFRQTLGGYLSSPSSLTQSANYLVKPHFKHSGLVGALLLAHQARTLKGPRPADRVTSEVTHRIQRG